MDIGPCGKQYLLIFSELKEAACVKPDFLLAVTIAWGLVEYFRAKSQILVYVSLNHPAQELEIPAERVFVGLFDLSHHAFKSKCKGRQLGAQGRVAEPRCDLVWDMAHKELVLKANTATVGKEEGTQGTTTPKGTVTTSLLDLLKLVKKEPLATSNDETSILWSAFLICHSHDAPNEKP